MPKRLTPRGDAAPPVEPIVTGATMPPRSAATTRKKQPPKPKETDNGVRYVRNLHHIKSRTTLTTGREIILEPRGQRDDVDIVNATEQEDPRFFANVDLLFELITVADAKKIISKQRHNISKHGPDLWDHLRNEKGDAYRQKLATIEEVFEQQGEVVGTVEETGAGRFTDKNVEVSRAAGPRVVQVPGSPDHPATELMQSVPSNIDPAEYHEFLLWKQFQDQKKAQDADAS